jgi:hypothetical protein
MWLETGDRRSHLLVSWLLLLHGQSSWPFSRSSSLPVAGRSSAAFSSTWLLSDLETPALLVDIDAARALILPPKQTIASLNHPSLQLNDTHVLAPLPDLCQAGTSGAFVSLREKERFVVPTRAWLHQDKGKCAAAVSSNIFFLHSRVICGRTINPPPNVRDRSAFLCQLDLPSVPTRPGETTVESQETEQPYAQLVLGLNNHHVGSYYWARSAGTGASMEAPGIQLEGGNCLCWKSSNLHCCNSNDGKRSEWVNFLAPGDQVQLVPYLSALWEQIDFYSLHMNRVFGVSMQGRPLGSEPRVVCQYQVAQRPGEVGETPK